MILPLFTAFLLAAPGPCDAWNPTHGDPGLHCIELVPRPEFEQVSGRVRLMPALSPFGLAVTADGPEILTLTKEQKKNLSQASAAKVSV